MNAVTSAFLVKSSETLSDARTSLDAGMPGQAGRLAHLSAFHAAQALIMENTNKAAKTHKGVHAKFAELAKKFMLDRSMSRFLSAAYHFKEAADYETGDLRVVSHEDARAALEMAEVFLLRVNALLESST